MSRCPRCSIGRLYANNDGDRSCVSCGNVIYQTIPMDIPTGRVREPSASQAWTQSCEKHPDAMAKDKRGFWFCRVCKTETASLGGRPRTISVPRFRVAPDATHCKYGHPYAFNKVGARWCPTCASERTKVKESITPNWVERMNQEAKG